MKEHGSRGFEWQEGYFACSVSQSQVPVVSRYVQNQKEHHRKIDSADEFALLLKRHGLVVREYSVPDCSVAGGGPALPCRAIDCAVPTGLLAFWRRPFCCALSQF